MEGEVTPETSFGGSWRERPLRCPDGRRGVDGCTTAVSSRNVGLDGSRKAGDGDKDGFLGASERDRNVGDIVRCLVGVRPPSLCSSCCVKPDLLVAIFAGDVGATVLDILHSGLSLGGS